MLGSLFGGILNLFGDQLNADRADDRQDDAQNFNSAEAAIARQFNAEQAAITRGFAHDEAAAQRRWEYDMSNSRYQRGRADLEAAGFNPMMAWMSPATYGSGASAGGGAVASAGAASSGIAGQTPGANLAGAMQSASQIEVNTALADRTRAEADEVRERTKNYDPQRREIEARIPLHQEQVNNLKQQIGESAVRIERIWEEVAQTKASAANIVQQTDNLKAALPLIKAQIAQLRALAAKESAETDEIKQRIKSDLPGLERTLGNLEALQMQMQQPLQANKERAADSFIGQMGAYLREINPLQGFIGVTPGRRHHTTIINRGR